MIRTAIVVLLACALQHVADASKPVETTLDGCVLDGRFYSIGDDIAYAMSTPTTFDLKPFEGKSIAIKGLLYPGDRFEPADGVKPEVKAPKCAAKAIALVRHEQVSRMAVDAFYAAKDGKFDQAVELVERAVAVVTPPECDILAIRGHILAMKGDTAAANKDVATIKARKACVVLKKTLNPLLLQDVGKALVAKGDKKGGIAALELALAECDGEWCAKDIKSDLAAAKK